MDKFLGKWKEVSKEGYDTFADTLGIDDEQKALYREANTVTEYQCENGQWTMVFGVEGPPPIMQTYRLQLGEKYAATDIDGSPMTSLINIEGDRFVETHSFDKWPNIELSVTREVVGDTMIVTTSYHDKSFKSTYKRV